ncbi:MAG: putative sulfate exporter family transporter [Patescibacteria group bacterium]
MTTQEIISIKEKNKKEKYLILFKNGWLGLLLVCLVGVISYLIQKVIKSPLLDPLFIALLLGIIIKLVIGEKKRLAPGFVLAPLIFIPIGVILYGAVNLNFVKFAQINIAFIILLAIVMLVYIGVILLLGKLLKQRKQITYLTATGSVVCGASAIAITTPAVEAEPDDVSISLISVFIVAVFGLFILFPFLTSLLGLSDKIYALLSAMTLQFTGFVKAATGNLSKELVALAISVKAARYLGLFIAIPFFASLTKKKFYIPWFLWLFLAAGFVFSFAPAIAKPLTPIFKPVLDVLWAIAMAAIGLNADIKALLSDNGLKALLMAFIGFIAAILVFILGILII